MKCGKDEFSDGMAETAMESAEVTSRLGVKLDKF